MICIRCNAEATGKFCQECGQKQAIPRLTLGSFFEDFLNRIYGLDGAVPNTIIGLWKHPGRVSREFIQGIRGKYVGPVGYYFLMFTLYFILISVLGVDMAEYADTKGMNEAINGTTGEELDTKKVELQEWVQTNIFKYLQYFTILFFPFFVLWAKVFFKKSKYNFLEQVVFLFFTNAQVLFINMAGVMVFAATGATSKLVVSGLGLFYFSYAASQFYENRLTFKSVLKSIFFYLLSYLTLFIVAGIIGIVIGITKKFLFG